MRVAAARGVASCWPWSITSKTRACRVRHPLLHSAKRKLRNEGTPTLLLPEVVSPSSFPLAPSPTPPPPSVHPSKSPSTPLSRTLHVHAVHGLLIGASKKKESAPSKPQIFAPPPPSARECTQQQTDPMKPTSPHRKEKHATRPTTLSLYPPQCAHTATHAQNGIARY